MTSPSNLRTQTRIAKVECSKLFDRSGMRVWLSFILYSCRCWQIYVGDCLGWYYQFRTYSHILSKMFLPKSIQINMVLGTSVLSETSSEVSIKKRTRNDFHWFPHLSCSLWLFEGCWSLRRARHWVISPPSRFVDWWLPGMRTLSSAKLVVSSVYDAVLGSEQLNLQVNVRITRLYRVIHG